MYLINDILYILVYFGFVIICWIRESKNFSTVSKQEMCGFITFSYYLGIKKWKRKKEIIKYLFNFIYSYYYYRDVEYDLPTFFPLVQQKYPTYSAHFPLRNYILLFPSNILSFLQSCRTTVNALRNLHCLLYSMLMQKTMAEIPQQFAISKLL